MLYGYGRRDLGTAPSPFLMLCDIKMRMVTSDAVALLNEARATNRAVEILVE